jgi:hypothetical protein
MADGIVPTDGPGNVKVPLGAADWTLLALPAPLVQWNCQETSGNLASAIGSRVLTATGSNLVYAATVAGWTRKFVGFSAETLDSRWANTEAALDSAAGESLAWLLYASSQVASASTRFILQIASLNSIRVNTTSLQHEHNGVVLAAATVPTLGTVKPWLWYRNATTNVSGMILPGDHTTTTHNESALSVTRGIGASGGSCAVCRVGLAAMWKGANAEAIAVPATLTALGW